MYTSNMDWAWGLHGLKTSEKLVLLFLAYEAGQASMINMTRDDISTRCDLSPRTVDRCIDSLVAQNLISVHAHMLDRENIRQSYLLHVVSRP